MPNIFPHYEEGIIFAIEESAHKREKEHKNLDKYDKYSIRKAITWLSFDF